MRNVIVEPFVGYVTSQFQRPRGPLGVMAGRIMSKRGSNSERNLWLVELLEPEPDSRVLEIGAGPGVALEAMAGAVTSGAFVVVDHSITMLRQAGKRNHRLQTDGRLTLVHGEAQRMPEAITGFDRIYCMNVWQFWDDQETTIADLVGRLNPGGRLGIGYQPRHPGATGADADAAGRCLRDQLSEAGLVDITCDRLELDPPVVAVIGRRVAS